MCELDYCNDVAYMDFSAVFGRVLHERLVQKLR